MKTAFALLVMLTGVSPVLALTPSSEPSTPPSAGTVANLHPELQVRVEIAPSFRPWITDRIAESFADRVADELKAQGYAGAIRYVDDLSTVDRQQPSLDIHLIEWRVDHVGFVDCTFAATLTSPRGSKNLGLFTGTSIMMFPRRDWFARVDSYDDAARQALSSLNRRITESKLIE